ncbi:MAG: YdcF family protein [Gammaproteobacteria bacterium]|nr:YdcF family protein [Gammaproteobacteria bacterium]
MLITQLVYGLLFPPALLILLYVAGLLLWQRRPGTARGMVVAATVLLVLATNPNVVDSLKRAVEVSTPISAEGIADAQAIVILGGGRNTDAVEYGGGDQVSTFSLIRARYGAWLARRTGLPVLLTGGAVRGEEVSEAGLMARLLEEEFGVPVRWREEHSRTTYENAVNSAAMLKAEGIGRIALVTSALHMRRSVEAFEKQGLIVHAAPTDITSREDDPHSRWLDGFLPRAGELREFTLVLHEIVGRIWYRLRYY